MDVAAASPHPLFYFQQLLQPSWHSQDLQLLLRTRVKICSQCQLKITLISEQNIPAGRWGGRVWLRFVRLGKITTGTVP